MASQNNPGRQFDRTHSTTVVAGVAGVKHRFIAYDGGYATSAGLAKDMQGVSQHDFEVGDAIAVTTHYSELVEASAAITFGAYVKPAADGSGRAAVGTLTDHCGRALGAAGAAGQLLEVQLVRHVHA